MLAAGEMPYGSERGGRDTPSPREGNSLMRIPPGACDTHVHVFDRSRPPAGLTPEQTPDASALSYAAVRDELGLERTVLVQANGYGTDNRCMLDGVRTLGPARTRAIAIVDADVSDAELTSLHHQGVRGLRFHMLEGGRMRWEDLEPLAARIAPLGWHIQLQMDGRDLPNREAALARLPCRLVVDHIGKFLEPVSVQHPGFRCLLRLVENGRSWVKLSAPYEVSRLGPPDYADVGALAVALVQAAPERMLWATNWPHPWFKDPPQDSAMLRLLTQWAPDTSAQMQILVRNPAELYDFAA